MSNQDGNQPYASYAPPAANLASASVVEEIFIPGGRNRPGKNGLTWVSSAWMLFKRQPGSWVLSLIVVGAIIAILPLLVITLAITLLPPAKGEIEQMLIIAGVGGIILCFSDILGILFSAGIIYACDRLRREGKFTFGDLFAGFSRRTGSLMMILLFIFCFSIVAGVVMGVAGALAGLFAHSLMVSGYAIGTIIVRGLGTLAVMMATFMALWFAPALVMMRDLPAFVAIKMSFSACLKNILPLTSFSIIMGLLLVVSAIPFGLGLLITGPMLWICCYTSYRDIFFDDRGECSR